MTISSENSPAAPPHDGKRCLIAFTPVGVMTAAMFPPLLKRAGYHIAMMGKARRRFSVCSGYDEWIDTSDDPREIIAAIVDRLRRNLVDWVILSDDPLLRALRVFDVPDDIKAKISTLHNSEALNLLGSKTKTAEFLSRHGITVPPYRICQNAKDIPAAAVALGFPLLVKLDVGQNAAGVFKCDNAADVEAQMPLFTGTSFIIETFIEGEQVGVEPLFDQGRLRAYTSAKVLVTDHETGLETRRLTVKEPELTTILSRMGEVLNLHGFCNLGFMKSRQDGKFYLFEADFRPNAWIPLDKHYHIDFAKALRNPLNQNIVPAVQTPEAGHEVRIFHREIEKYLREHNWRGLWQWATNADKCWRFLPSGEPGFVARTVFRLILAPTFRKGKQQLQKIKKTS